MGGMGENRNKKRNGRDIGKRYRNGSKPEWEGAGIGGRELEWKEWERTGIRREMGGNRKNISEWEQTIMGGSRNKRERPVVASCESRRC
eukprot:1276335-Pyramimonas_sp.AAC.1